MALSEKIQLLGASVYKDIPKELTLTGIPTISELDYVGSEDFDNCMIEKIFPVAIEEKINYRQLLQIDYYWICRCLRFLNYGPYFTTNAIYCSKCGPQYGEYQVNLSAIECIPLPEDFVNEMVVSPNDFIDYGQPVKFQLITIGKYLSAINDKAFMKPGTDTVDRDLARICYSIIEIGGNNTITPLEVKLIIEKELTPADYIMLKDKIEELSNYGLRAGGRVTCPKCGNPNATFIALTDDRFFRPTARNLQSWKADKSKKRIEERIGSKETSL